MKSYGKCRLVCLMLALCPAKLAARPVGAGGAASIVKGWLRADARPLGATLGTRIERIETFSGEDAQPIYYVVCLQPSGFVIVPADNEVEPILCFSQDDTFDPSENTPLAALVNADVPARIAAAKASQAADDGPHVQGKAALRNAVRAAGGKWNTLSALESDLVGVAGLGGVSDVRVAPLTQSTWGQTTVGDYIGGTSCYNHYTPPYGPGNAYNYPIGCVAAATSQLLRYHEHPAHYNWSNMPLQPDESITLVQRQAIGGLCYDVAETISTDYGPPETGGSLASLADGDEQLTGHFGYSNSIHGRYPSTGATLNKMVNTNLDAHLPVLLGFSGPTGNHAVVCDGYGYNVSTLYHHLNMGWSGNDDAWYALPIVDAYSYFNAIHTCIYNIYTSGTDEIISGRAVDMAGNPIPGVQVVATPSGHSPRFTTTNAQGIYSFANLPPNKYVTLTAGKAPHLFANQAATTGRSADDGATGNVWAVNFYSTSHCPPTAYPGTASATSGQTESITLYATDDGHPNPPGQICYKISLLPLYGSLSDPGGGEITTVPYTIAGCGNAVNYRSCSYFTGTDTFYFQANDGGTTPEGGDSAPAPVTVDVNNVTFTTYEPQTGWIAKWPLMTDYEDSRTQVIYLASDVGATPNTIAGLALNVSQRPGYQLNYWTIRMKHTGRTAFWSEPYFETSGWTTVYFNHEPRPTTGWYWFEFQTPFEYNGTSNLMIDFSHDNNSWGDYGTVSVSDMGVPRVVLGYSDSMHGSPLYWDDRTFYPYYPSYATAVPNIRLKSVVTGAEPLIGDFVQNCRIDLADLIVFCDAWLSSLGNPRWRPACDISDPQDDFINELDFAPFAENWRQSTE